MEAPDFVSRGVEGIGTKTGQLPATRWRSIQPFDGKKWVLANALLAVTGQRPRTHKLVGPEEFPTGHCGVTPV